jgi:hypothetical protein
MINYGSLHSVSLFGGIGQDPGHGGGETYNVASTRNAPVTITGGQNPNTFNITPFGEPESRNVGYIQAPVTLSGGGGGRATDTLFIFDQDNHNSGTYTITDTTVKWYSSPITYSSLITYLNMRSMVLNGNNAGIYNANTYNVESTGALTPVTIAGGAGTNNFEISPTDHHLDNIASMLTIVGGTGANTIHMHDDFFVDNYTVTNTSTTVPSLSSDPLLNYSGVNTLLLDTKMGSTVTNMTTTPVTLAVTYV